MTSELSANPLRLKQWEACKKRILDRLAALAEIEGKTIIDMLPDIRIIKENQLWKLGGYQSFNEFCGKALGVSRQYVYRVLSVNQDACKVLEINGENGENAAKLTSGVLDALLLEGAKAPEPTPLPPAEKALNEAPKKTSKGRRPKPEPEPIEGTFTEPTPATFPATVTESEAIEQERERWEKKLGVCPHCGGAI